MTQHRAFRDQAAGMNRAQTRQARPSPSSRSTLQPDGSDIPPEAEVLRADLNKLQDPALARNNSIIFQ
jgi:hypothetical protein